MDQAGNRDRVQAQGVSSGAIPQLQVVAEATLQAALCEPLTRDKYCTCLCCTTILGGHSTVRPSRDREAVGLAKRDTAPSLVPAEGALRRVAGREHPPSILLNNDCHG